MSLDAAFHAVANKSSVSSLISGLCQSGFDFINTVGNTYVNCLTRPEADDVILINIEQETAPRFYALCAAHPDNNFLPHIHEMESDGKLSVLRMEKLVALDHVDIDPADADFLNSEAPKYIRYIRGESTREEAAELEDTSPHLKSTAQAILKVSQDVYHQTNGNTLPFCDLKVDNIFLRKTANGNELVFGDPLFPGSGKNEDNMQFMENAYKRFGLPPLQQEKVVKRVLVPAGYDQ